MKTSVCLATYNGELYVSEQVRSILKDIDEGDEVIIVDDASTDNTLRIIGDIRDPRIKIFTSSTNVGHVKAFEKALSHATGDHIALSDQDDIWPRGRTAELARALADSDLSAGNYVEIGGSPPETILRSRDSGRPLVNILGLLAGRRPYFGSCMMMTRQLRDKVLPFPAETEAHDHWLAIAGNVLGVVSHVEQPSVTHRRTHDNNLTPKAPRSLRLILRTRWIQLRHVQSARKRR